MRTTHHLALFLFWFVLIKGELHGTNLQRRCSQTAENIKFSSIRKANFEMRRNDSPLCDKYLIPQKGAWYKSWEDLVANATHPFSCGTEMGIWMNGSIPLQGEGVVERQACVPGMMSDCDFVIKILVENCGKYKMYFLKPPSLCPAAYCFGYGEKGSPPSVTVERPTVTYFMKIIQGFRTYEELQFSCIFTPLNDSALFYQIYWYINGQLLLITDPKQWNEIADTNLTTTNGLTTLNVQFACSVSVKRKPNQQGGPLSEISNLFFAGIQATLEKKKMVRGGIGIIHFVLSVPFPCIFDNVQDSSPPESCFLSVELLTPTSNDCESKIAAVQSCAYPIKRTTWNINHSFTIQHIDNGGYELLRDYTIRYRTNFQNMTRNMLLWNNIDLPEIKVYVEEPATLWKGLSCYAHSDPHMRTFENQKYENQNPGTYTMYYSKDTNGNTMEVQIKVTRCNYGAPHQVFCVCALAVRAAGDVFLIDRCTRRKRFGYRSCKDGLLDVWKSDEFNYKIVYPSGTTVKARLWIYEHIDVMEIEIFPTSSDVQNTQGLCNKLGSKNFYARNGKISTIADFAKSWIVDDSENLISMSDKKVLSLESQKRTAYFCTCNKTNGTKSSNITICDKKISVSCDLKKQVQVSSKSTCSVRSKRSVSSKFSFVPDNTQYSFERKKRSKDTNYMQMTPGQARDFCNNFMNKSEAFKACSNIPSVRPEDAIDDCILDVQLTNSTIWAAVSREGLKSICAKELNQNNTLWRSKAKIFAHQIMTIMCPNECSNNGECDNGTCTCFNGFGAADCSRRLGDPPNVIGVNIDNGGICEKSDCSNAIISGDMFLDISSLTCKMTHFGVSKNGIFNFHESYLVSGAHNTISDIRCPLPNLRLRRSVDQNDFVSGYKIAISNNAEDFSSTHFLYILDSVCQDTLNISGQLKFALKDDFCFINGRCVASGTQDGSNSCNYCDVKLNAFDWSLKLGIEECKKNTVTTTIWPICVAFALFAIMVMAALVIVWINKRKESNDGHFSRCATNVSNCRWSLPVVTENSRL